MTFGTTMEAVALACAQVEELRQWVRQHCGIHSGTGDRWLPVVLTARGPLYGEVIGRTAAGHYVQPVATTDAQKQPLYGLARHVLDHLAAPPAVYLFQVAFGDPTLTFDRLIPFPDHPAIASVGVQEPDLFRCHWLCLTGNPIRDLIIHQTS
ncbi:MAG: hypothetical protein HC919_03525 [Oscillatoriales cyanobacterium SM2_2_1]|nr:hypothetical protein [Oscillatoriales cyanobacterium SM2_2_1]